MIPRKEYKQKIVQELKKHKIFFDLWQRKINYTMLESADSWKRED